MSDTPHTLWPWLLLLPAAAALVVAGVSRRDGGVRPARTLRALSVAGPVSGLAALLAAVAALLAGPSTAVVPGGAWLGAVLRLDPLSTVLTLLVTFVAIVVLRYSRNALDGDPRHGRFLGDLARTIACVQVLVVAGNVVLFAAAWILTGLALERLLRFHADRPRAVAAARQHAFFARISDLALCGAAFLLVRATGTADIGAILAEARGLAGSASLPVGWGAAALLLCVAAIGKSAQFPAHVWLPRSMESPTPVSALLHAGVVNAGGFLLVRFSDVLVLVPAALVLLLAVGGVTLLLGAWVTTLQADRKGRLAWSTVAQMGLMVFQCGLGAFSLAVLHIVAHSLYKAHAFLTAGSVVTRTVHPEPNGTHGGLSPRGWALGVLATAAVLLAIDTLSATLGGPSIAAKPGAVFIGAVLVLGIAPTVARDGARLAHPLERWRPLATVALLAGLYLLWTGIFDALLADSVAPVVGTGAAAIAVATAVVIGLALLSFLPSVSARLARSETWARAEVHLRHGLYLTTLFDRPTATVARRGGSS